MGVEACAGRAATSATKAASVASPSFTPERVLLSGKNGVKTSAAQAREHPVGPAHLAGVEVAGDGVAIGGSDPA